MAGKADIALKILTTETMGATATDRAAAQSTPYTLVDKSNPASIAGVVTKVEVYAQTSITLAKIGVFYNISGNVLSCRDWTSIGAVTAGSKQTFTVDANGDPLAISVEIGDYIGIYGTDGAIELGASSGNDFWRSVSAGDWTGTSNLTYALVEDYAISLRATISTRYGFRLANSKDGSMAWNRQQAPVLRPGQSMGPVSYADVPPEQELVWDSQRSAHGGFGQLDLSEGGDPTRYYTAANIDARFSGKVFCGPLLQEASQAPALGGAGLNGPVYCGCEHEGCYLIGAGRAVYQNLKPYSLTSTAGITMTFHETEKTITLSGATWDTEALAVGRTFTVVGSGAGNDGLYTVAIITTTVITAAEDFAAEVGDDDPEIVVSTDFWRLVVDSGEAKYTIPCVVSSNAYAYVCIKGPVGEEGAYRHSPTGNSGDWTEATGNVPLYADFLAALNENLWRFNQLNVADNAAVAPAMGGNWSADYKVGDKSYDFTWVLNHRGILVIGKEDGLYSIDQYGNAEQLIPELRASSHELNFRRMLSWKGLVFMPMGGGGLWTWPGQPYDDLSPRRFAPHDPNYQGQVGGLAWDNNWIWATVQGSATDGVVSGSAYNVGLLAGAFIQDAYGARWVWHPIASYVDDESHYLIIFRAPTTNQPRMWVFRGTNAACGNTGDYTPSYIDLPRYTDNPLEATDDQDTDYAYNFASGGSITFSKWDGNLRNMTKAFFSMTFKGSNLANVTSGDQRYIEFDYKIDDDDWILAATSGFTLEGDAEDDGVTVEEEFFFPSNTTGKTLTVRFKLYTTVASGNPKETPVLELPFVMKCRVRPTSAKQVAFSVICEDNIAGGLSAAQIRAAWDDAFNAEWPVTVVGPGGTEYTGTVQSPTPMERNVVRKHPPGNVSSIIDIMLLEADLS